MKRIHYQHNTSNYSYIIYLNFKVIMRPQWQTIFVSGGAGYIGSHCILELLHQDYEVIAVDNFVNSVDENGEAISLKKVRQITGREVTFYQCDLLDKAKLDHIFSQV